MFSFYNTFGSWDLSALYIKLFTNNSVLDEKTWVFTFQTNIRNLGHLKSKCCKYPQKLDLIGYINHG